MADVIKAILKTQDIVGKPVISLQGEEIGSILRVIVNPEKKQVAGFTINMKGLFKGEKAIEFDQVNSFGDYAVIVESFEKILPLENLPVIEKLSKDYNLYNMRVVTPQGKLIGVVEDFYFNTNTGQIDKYIISGGLIKNLFKGKAVIPAEKIQSTGKDVLMAADGAENTIVKEDTGLQESILHLKNDLDSFKDELDLWKDEFDKNWEKTRVKALEISKSVGENIKEAARSGRSRSKEVISKTSEILIEKKKQLQTSYEWWLDRLQFAKISPNTPLPQHDVNILIGLRAGRTVFDNNGIPIVPESGEITQEVVDTCQRAGKIRELLISIASKDLEDKIKSIEEDKMNSTDEGMLFEKKTDE